MGWWEKKISLEIQVKNQSECSNFSAGNLFSKTECATAVGSNQTQESKQWQSPSGIKVVASRIITLNFDEAFYSVKYYDLFLDILHITP